MKKIAKKSLIMIVAAMFLTKSVSSYTAFASIDPGLLSQGGGESASSSAVVEAKPETSQPQAATKTTTTSKNYQSEIDKISDKMKSLEKEKKDIEADIKDAKTEKQKELANRNNVDRQIGIVKDEIALLLERIGYLEADIEEKQLDIRGKQIDIDYNYQQFKTRLKVMQLNDETTTLGLLFGADSFVDFLSKAEIVGRIAEYDRALMKDLTEQRNALEEEKIELETIHDQVLVDKEDTENKKQELGTKLAAANLAIQDIEKMEKEFLADLKKNEASQAAMQKELDDIYKKIKWDQSPYIGGEMQWPVPGAYKITSPYGWRFAGKDFHTGMDITYNGGGTYGATIVAANSGTVKFVNTSYTNGVSYGMYLIIDHGGGVSTLYAHCSSIVVNTGDVVQKNQKIAEVGSTGWSTGPHLHFEVRINGKHTNPYPYVAGGTK